MEQIILTKKNGTQIKFFSKEYNRTVQQAVQDISLMGDDTVSLSITSGTLIDFGIGDKIVVDNNEYSIRTIPSREIVSENLFSYEVKLYGVIYELIKSQYRDTDINGVSKRSTFDLTYSLKDFIKVIIHNVSRDYPGIWVFDEANCPDTEPKTLSFSKQNCLQVLQTVCNEFKFDFVINQANGIRTIKVGNFGRVIVPPSGSTHFEWGKGLGLFNLKEKKIDDKSIITRLWVEGGTKNLKAGYRDFSDRLQLPYPARMNTQQHKLHDGTVIEPYTQFIGIFDDAKRYIEDATMKNSIGSIEDTEYFDEIFPHRTGVISALGADIYSFVDNEMDFDLKAKDAVGNTLHLIDGVSAKITFITGKLAGMQFELEDYTHGSKTFKIIKHTDERGLSFPTVDSTAFRFKVGDKYKITDINLPDVYVESAEEKLWFAGYNAFLKRKQAMAQYELVFDRDYFIKALPIDSSSTVFKPGDYIPIKDTRFGIEKNIRIQNVKRNMLLSHDYSLTLSDTTAISIYNKTILDVLEHNIIIERNRLRDVNKARLGWRTTEELRTMVYDSDGFFDVDNIRPNSIDTNMLTVGSRSQQYLLLNTIMQANIDGNPNRFHVSAGQLAHFTINDDGTIRTWNMSAIDTTISQNGGYYVFAKCSKINNTGSYHITQEQLKVENADANNYYFQVGIIGSLDAVLNFRDFVTTYGFTRINGNTITTGKIRSSGGTDSYFDLDENQFRIGDNKTALLWNINNNGKLVLKGTMVQSGSGAENVIGVWRGNYSNTTLYFAGDEIYYNGNSYRCILDCPTAGIMPINTTYWTIIAAKGADGLTRSPQIGASGNWEIWDEVQNKYVDSGVKAQGENGIAPRISSDGFWEIWDGSTWVKTTVKAQGENGRSLIYAYTSAVDKPEKPTSQQLTPVGWKSSPDDAEIIVPEPALSSWVMVSGWWISNKISGNQTTKMVLNFTSSKPNQTVFFDVKMSSELNYDWGYIGKLNESVTEYSYFDRISGQVSKTYSINIPTAGSHVIEIMYKKDGTQDGFNDNMSVRILTPEIWYIESLADEETAFAWSEPKKFIADTSTVESIYCLSTGSVPKISGSDNVSEYLPMPCDAVKFRGVFSLSTQYQAGDVVYENNKYYEVLQPTINRGVSTANYFKILMPWTDVPSGTSINYNTEYISVRKKENDTWGAFSAPALFAKFAVDGNFTEYRYAKNGSSTTPPDVENWSDTPTGWSLQPPTLGTLEYLWMISAVKNQDNEVVSNGWTTPVRISGMHGINGKSPALVYRGNYQQNTTYYGNENRVDAVMYAGSYYVARIDAGEFLNVLPTDTSKWNSFGASFESIATGLLLAENANIANFIFRNQLLTSQNSTNGQYNIMLDGATGKGHFAAGIFRWDESGNVIFGKNYENKSIQISPNSNIPLITEIQNKGNYTFDNHYSEKFADFNNPAHQNIWHELNHNSNEFTIETNAEFTTFQVEVVLSHNVNALIMDLEMLLSFEKKNDDGTWSIVNQFTQGDFKTDSGKEYYIDLEKTDQIITSGTYRVRTLCRFKGMTNGANAYVHAYIASYIDCHLIAKKIVIASDGIAFYDTTNDNMLRISLDGKIIQAVGDVEFLSPDKSEGIEITNNGVRIKRNNSAWQNL